MGDDNQLMAVAFSPDGKTLVSGSSDGTVRLWNAITNSEPQSLYHLDKWVHQVAFSPDSKYAAVLASGNPGSLTLWDVAAVRGDRPPISRRPTKARSFSPDRDRMRVQQGPGRASTRCPHCGGSPTRWPPVLFRARRVRYPVANGNITRRDSYGRRGRSGRPFWSPKPHGYLTGRSNGGVLFKDHLTVGRDCAWSAGVSERARVLGRWTGLLAGRQTAGQCQLGWDSDVMGGGRKAKLDLPPRPHGPGVGCRFFTRRTHPGFRCGRRRRQALESRLVPRGHHIPRTSRAVSAIAFSPTERTGERGLGRMAVARYLRRNCRSRHDKGSR